MQVRVLEVGDRPAVLALVRAAFTMDGKDGAFEVEVVEQTWQRGAALPGLELVAEVDGEVVGHLVASRSALGDAEVPAIAPLSVIPGRQRQGVGSALLVEVLRRAEDAGWSLVALLGDPGYYGRFGFEPSWPWGITYPPAGEQSPYFQVRRFGGDLPQGALTFCWEDPPH